MRHRAVFLLPLLLGLAACADIARPAPAAPSSPPPVAVSAAAPAAVTTPSAAPNGPVVTDASGAAAIVRATATSVSPRLLPTALPAGMEVTVRSVSAGDFDVEYTDDVHTHTIIVITDEPSGVNGPHQTMTQVQFRGHDATYQVFDTTVPTSRRVLYWKEPGTQVQDGQTFQQVGYYLSATGYTDAEFFQLANSLEPV